MSNHKGRYVVKMADNIIPREIMEQLLASTAINCAGFVTPTVVDDKSLLDGDVIQTKPSVDEMMKLQEEWKDSELFIHIGQYPDKFDEGAVQPISLLEDKEGDSLVTVVLDGNFKYNFSGKENAAASTEYMICEKVLRPVMAKAFKAAGGDVEKLFEELKTDPALPPLINSLYKDRASVTFIGVTGDTLTIGDKHEFDGWWTSNKDGITVAEPEIEIVTQPTRRGFGRRNLQPDAPEGLPAEKEGSTAPLDKAAGSEGSTVKSAVHADKQEDGIWMAPPSTWTKAQKKKWYEDNNDGVVPPNYKTSPKVLIKAVKSLDQIKEAIDGKKGRPIAEVEPIRQVNTGHGEILPIAPPNEKTYLHDNFFKLGAVQKVISDGNPIVDPKKQKAYESKFTSFIEMAKLPSLNNTLALEFAERLELCKEAPHIAAILMQDLSYALAEERKLIHDPVEPKEKVETPAEKLAAAKAAKGKAAEEPAAEEPPATRRRGFGNRNVA